MSSRVLDASALLAYIKGEPGEERVAEAIAAGSIMSTVNLAEVVSKLANDGVSEDAIRRGFDVLRGGVEVFGVEDAVATGLLRPATRAAGLSLGDRACLALARSRGLPALTSDGPWLDVAGDLGVEVEAFR